jgi:hypothetical protein
MKFAFRKLLVLKEMVFEGQSQFRLERGSVLNVGGQMKEKRELAPAPPNAVIYSVRYSIMKWKSQK